MGSRLALVVTFCLALAGVGAGPSGASWIAPPRPSGALSLVTGEVNGLHAPTLPRATADRPDDFPGLQIHMVYAVPSDRPDRAFDTDGSIENSVAAFQRWLTARTGGRALRVDTYQGSVDVTFRRMATSDDDYPAYAIVSDLRASGILSPTKLYGVYYDGGAAAQTCGGASWPDWPDPAPDTIAGIYLNGLGGACFSGFPPPGGSPTYLSFAMLHDLTHTMGIAPLCAPHFNYTNYAHVTDSNTDLMWGGDYWNPSVVDFGHDDYFGASIPGCAALDTVGTLAAPTTTVLTVSKEGIGRGVVRSSPWPVVDCGSSCSAGYPTGTVVALTAVNLDGDDSIFDGWSGACTGTARCLVTLDSPKTVTARFSYPRRTLYVGHAGRGSGLVTSTSSEISCRNECSAEFDHGKSIVLHAKASLGSRFVGWQGDCTGRGRCSLLLDADKFADAAFADVLAPRVRALPSTGRRGGLARFRYRVSENSGVARVTVRLSSATRRALSGKFQKVSSGKTYVLKRRIPSLRSGARRFCITARDQSGHRSKISCAALSVR
jgi:hypothetical protein